MSDLSVLILCGRSPRHLYVANMLCESARPVAIVQETGSQWNGKKFRRLLNPVNLWRKGWRWLRDRGRYTGGAEAKFFFGSRAPFLARPDLLVEVPHINHPDVVRLAQKLQPDVIAVFGTSLIRGALLKMGRIGLFNLHGGLSPEYRGADCTFWALHNGEPEKVGCTLHRIDAGIDTGALIALVCPEVKGGDDELSLFWRAVHDSAEAFGEMLARLERGERLGQVQPGKGRLYQVRDRSWRAERALAQHMQQGLLQEIHLPKRVRWFSEASTVAENPEGTPSGRSEG
jgi:hypothetical protein